MKEIEIYPQEVMKLSRLKKVHCVSMATTFNEEDTLQDRKAKWERQCIEASRLLRHKMSLDSHDIDLTMAPAYNLLRDAKWWSQDMRSMVHFLSADHVHLSCLPYVISEFIYIDDHYMTSPLIGLSHEHNKNLNSILSLDKWCLSSTGWDKGAVNFTRRVGKALDEHHVNKIFFRNDIFKSDPMLLKSVNRMILRAEECGGRSIMIDKNDWPSEQVLLSVEPRI